MKAPRRSATTSDRPVEPLLDLADVCDLFGITSRAAYNRRHRGDFPPAIKVGSTLRWRVEDITAWLDEHRDEGVRG